MTEAGRAPSVAIHPTADVAKDARIGEGTRIWHWAQVREGAAIGRGCNIGKGVYIDRGVAIGDNVKIQNHVSVYHGVRIEDGVFVGPHVCFTNDRHPRAITPDGRPKQDDDWELGETLVRYGASLGANAVIVPGVTVGRWALVAAGTVVTRDVPDHALVRGNPGRVAGWVCTCARPLQAAGDRLACAHCGANYRKTENGVTPL